MNSWEIDLSGKATLVTGGSRGLGKAIALAMAEKGAKVAGKQRGHQHIHPVRIRGRREAVGQVNRDKPQKRLSCERPSCKKDEKAGIWENSQYFNNCSQKGSAWHGNLQRGKSRG